MKQFFANSKLLFKASYYNSVIVLVRILKGIVVSKILAHYLGPNGFALLGNLKNFTQVITGFTAESYQNAAIRYTSEYKDNDNLLSKTYATIFQVSLSISIIAALIILLFSETFSVLLFQTTHYAYVLKILAIGLPFISFNFIILYILNGLEAYKKLTVINLSLSIVNLVITVLLVINYNLPGALVSLIFGPILVFFLNLVWLGEYRKILINIFNTKLFSIDILKNMNRYLIMAVYSTVLVAIAYLLIRNMIIEKYSLKEAGYWDAMNRISGFYVMFFISLTSFYLLPRLAKINTFRLFKNELGRFYKLVIPLLIVSCVMIYYTRVLILKLFLSSEFLEVETLFFWRLIGDFISILAIALVKQFHAKLLVKAYLICNGLQYAMYVGFSAMFIENQGVVGVMKAYTLSYFIYLILVVLFVANDFKKNSKSYV
ncbi:MAG: O-antigen translocase [Winogradskyella sp.]|uniref:O-antigen translocase n=1 Tax=Winogradskyella sp. TaxID=1883156 RepID=UPI000F40B888|nr:O-antigen translocase [Winogradskyella sp.]RNC84988.1 MAG: O-antigen translocase [Winogradskyella sp.]